MIEIVLPWFPKELMPNWKRAHHWSAYRKPAKEYRTLCGWIAKAANIQAVPAEPFSLTVAFYPPDRRRRDDDSLVGAFKHGRDGIADALGIDDNLFRPTYSFHDPMKPGKVIVSF